MKAPAWNIGSIYYWQSCQPRQKVHVFTTTMPPSASLIPNWRWVQAVVQQFLLDNTPGGQAYWIHVNTGRECRWLCVKVTRKLGTILTRPQILTPWRIGIRILLLRNLSHVFFIFTETWLYYLPNFSNVSSLSTMCRGVVKFSNFDSRKKIFISRLTY